jgi:hypothetical protein
MNMIRLDVQLFTALIQKAAHSKIGGPIKNVWDLVGSLSYPPQPRNNDL